MSSDRRRALAQIAQDQNIFIIEDGAYHFLGQNTQPAVASFAPGQVIYIASMSKTLAPGLRMLEQFAPFAYNYVINAYTGKLVTDNCNEKCIKKYFKNRRIQVRSATANGGLV